MATNAVAPWVGELDWVGEPNSGKTQNGKEWKSVDFTLKYQDSQMNEKFIVFSAFGVDKVDKLLSLPAGTTLKVAWWPEANFARNNGKWYPKLSAISINVVTGQQPKTEKVAAPNFPPNPVQQYQPAQPTHNDEGDSDLPF